MTVRLTGMFSGMDTDALIKDLVEAQEAKNKKTVDKKVKLEWKDEIWKELNTKLLKLHDEYVYNMKLQKNYTTKKVSGSDETKVTATADSVTPQGSHQISVNRLASSQYVTSAQIMTEGFGKNTLLSDVGFTAGESVIHVDCGDEHIQFDVTAESTVQDFLSACKDAGVNASYDENQKRIFISSDGSGEENGFTITSGTYTADGVIARDAITSLVDMSVGDNTSEVSAALLTLQGEGDTTEAEAKLVDLAKEKVNSEAQNKVNTFYFDSVKQTITLDADTIHDIEESKKDIVDETERNEAIEAAKEAEITKQTNDILATAEYVQKISDSFENGIDSSEVTAALGITDAGEIANYTCESEMVRVTVAENDMTSAIADYKALYAGASSAQTTVDPAISALKNLGLGEITDLSSDLSATDTGSYTMITAKNSSITYNGVDMENSSNNVMVNGLTLDLKGVTTEAVTVNVSQDTDASYNMIKEFVTNYNEILEEMNNLYYADSARSYAPLSDDEKDAMTDTQIENWETKIKDSLLRRDTMLQGVTNGLKTALLTTVTVDGKNYALSSFGIGTSSDYTEKGKLHIDGDSEEFAYKDKTSKLKEALIDDPELVMEVFTQIGSKLSETLSDKMKKTSLSGARTFYNNTDISKQIIALNLQIKEDADAVTAMEDRYYDQFAAMETALAKLQSQQSQLAGLMGY